MISTTEAERKLSPSQHIAADRHQRIYIDLPERLARLEEALEDLAHTPLDIIRIGTERQAALPQQFKVSNEALEIGRKLTDIFLKVDLQRWQFDLHLAFLIKHRAELVDIVSAAHTTHVEDALLALLSMDMSEVKDLAEKIAKEGDNPQKEPLHTLYRIITSDAQIAPEANVTWEIKDEDRINDKTGEIKTRARAKKIHDAEANVDRDIAIRKLHDKKWWVRQLKKRMLEVELQMSQIYGRIGPHRKWVSTWAIERQRTQITWQNQWIKKQTLVREEDHAEVPLEDVVRSAEEARFAENTAIAHGMQEIYEKTSLEMVMVTITLPGEWSPSRAKDRKSVFNGRSPAEANRTLSELKKQIRMGICHGINRVMAFSVKESQQTGVPHAHDLVLTSDAQKTIEIAKSYRLFDCPGCGAEHQLHEVRDLVTSDREIKKPTGHHKKTADGKLRPAYRYEQRTKVASGTCPSCKASLKDLHIVHQIDARTWSTESDDADQKGSLATYIFKYLAKGQILDPSNPDAADPVAYAAWRAACRARTTSWYGMGKGFKARWRAVYRADITASDKEGRLTIHDKAFLNAKEAMNNKKWGLALAIIAGLPEDIQIAVGAEKEVPLKWTDQVEHHVSSYGESRPIRIAYVMENRQVLPLTTGDWTMFDSEKLAAEKKAAYDGILNEEPKEKGWCSGKAWEEPVAKAKTYSEDPEDLSYWQGVKVPTPEWHREILEGKDASRDGVSALILSYSRGASGPLGGRCPPPGSGSARPPSGAENDFQRHRKRTDTDSVEFLLGTL